VCGDLGQCVRDYWRVSRVPGGTIHGSVSAQRMDTTGDRTAKETGHQVVRTGAEVKDGQM